MDRSKLRPARLDQEAMQILLDAEASINRCAVAGSDPHTEIFLIAMHDGK